MLHLTFEAFSGVTPVTLFFHLIANSASLNNGESLALMVATPRTEKFAHICRKAHLTDTPGFSAFEA